MHNVCMRVVHNHMSLVRTRHRDHMYLAYYVLCSRVDHGMRSRNPIRYLHRSRSCFSSRLCLCYMCIIHESSRDVKC